MRIGLVCPYDMGKPGGVQQLTSELGTQLRKRGIEVVYVGAGTSWFHGGPGTGDETIAAGRAISLRANSSKVPLTLIPTGWPRVRRALSSVDVVHVHEPLIPLVGWMALSMGKPTVATFHADPTDWMRRLYRSTPGLQRMFREHILTAVSPTAASAIPEGWGAVRIIPNAIDVESYRLPTGRIDRRVAFLGRDEPRKGLSVLLDAWPHVIDAVPEAQLVVMGAEREDRVPGVIWSGPVSGGEKRRVLASSRLYVAPNLGGESFGLVIAEAMAAGCAVVASDIPAFVDVADGAARLFPPGDSDKLAERVIEVLEDDALAARLADAGRIRVARFDWAKVVADYIDVYERALS